jgi:hypothetical protein
VRSINVLKTTEKTEPKRGKKERKKTKDEGQRDFGLVVQILTVGGIFGGRGTMDPAVLDDIINRLLECRQVRTGKQVQLMETEIRQLCSVSREIFLQQPNLLEIEAPIKICGAFSLGSTFSFCFNLGSLCKKFVFCCWFLHCLRIYQLLHHSHPKKPNLHKVNFLSTLGVLR